MVEQDPFHPGTTNPGRYAHLPDSGEDSDAASRRPSRTCHRVFVAALFVCGLVLVFLGFRKFTGGGSDDSGDDDIDCLTTPSTKPADLRAFSRGPADGVSEKANLLLAGDLPVCTWNNSVLAWERTSFHFQPENNWMNDPNGPLYYNGWYHIFYQYYPSAAVWGSPIVWGHAVSRDLINWLHLPLAMISDQWYDARGVWSGSATVLPTGEIVMLYTGSTNESVQVQNLAYPVDLSDPLLLEWAKYSGNPILYPPPGIDDKDFRDPTTAWQASNGKWRITIGSKVNRTGIAFVYETTDFKSYDRLDGILHGVPTTGMWECVDFYPVSTSEDVGLDTSVNGPDVKHVVKASLDDTRHDYYALGSYFEKNDTWIPDIPQIDVGIGIRYDYGVYYASKSFYDPKTQRRILWSWIGESDSEAADIKKGWASLQGLPRTVVLDRKTKSNLLQWPVKEVESLRMEKLEFKDIELHPGSTEALDVSPATQLDIEAVFEVEGGAVEKAAAETKEKFRCSSGGGAGRRGALGPFGVVVLADKRRREQTPIYFYIAKGEGGKLKTFFCSDHTRSSLAADVKKDIYGNFVPVMDDENWSMRVIVDHTIVESFAQGGRTCITSRVYPTRAVLGAARILVFNNATDTAVKASLNVWHMNAADIRVYNPRRNHH